MVVSRVRLVTPSKRLKPIGRARKGFALRVEEARLCFEVGETRVDLGRTPLARWGMRAIRLEVVRIETKETVITLGSKGGQCDMRNVVSLEALLPNHSRGFRRVFDEHGVINL
eukprot:scaffold72860_cov26-Tisochrysis_lutea.AAC.2